jgi:DNA repair protein RecN (Recombination protein N)
MLTQIHIRDLAIVSSLELELGEGLSALTGETGAGKSILIDALGLALGERADNSMIRGGCDKAEITAVFNIAGDSEVLEWLREHALENGEECMLRRVLVQSGSSRAFVNGSPVTIKLLQSLGDLLVDIHGQHAHQSLLHRGHQRDLLDEYANHMELRRQLEQLFQRWRETGERLEQLRIESADRSEKLELLRYQAKELQELGLQPEELRLLDEEHKKLSNADKLQEGCGRLIALLYDDERSLQSRLAQAGGELEEMINSDASLGEVREMVENASIQLQEAAHALRHYLDGVESNPARLEEVENRLSDIHDLSRKHRCKAEELPQLLLQMQNSLEELENADQNLATLEQEVAALRSDYLAAAATLDGQRRAMAERLEEEVTAGMQSLGMPGGRFAIGIESLPEEKATANGLNRIEFQVSANPGQAVKPLAKVASGGELSRISLAIQVATARCSGVPTLIFDEVDVGIGGGTAEIVGKLLRQLGDFRQVLCVTHLPQVAAQGHHHLQVSKSGGGNGSEVQTEISALDGETRIQEIARMLGGVEITPQTLAHAEEMVGNSQT